VKHPQKLFIRFTLLLVERAGELTGLFLVEFLTYGSVRGVPGNRYPYRDKNS